MRMRGLKERVVLLTGNDLAVATHAYAWLEGLPREIGDSAIGLQLMRMRGLKAVAVAQLPGRGGCNSCVCLSCDHEKRRLFIGKRLKHSK